MKVRTKLISVLALLFAVMIVLEIVIETRVLMPSFAELERDDARTSLKRVDSALNMALDNLELTAADWGNWADVYQFVQSSNPAFLKENVTQSALKQLQVSSLTIIDLRGNVVASESYDLDSGRPLTLGLAVNGALPKNFPWLGNLAAGTPARGLIRTSHGIMMIASAPVLDGSGTGATRGMVIMGKLLTGRQLRLIGAQTQVGFALQPLGAFSGTEDQLIETDDVTQVYRRYADVYGKPLVSLRVEVPRRITERGSSAVAYASACLMVAGVAALLLLVLVVNRVILRPLARVTQHAVALGQGADLTARLNLPGGDELAVLAREFDGMVERVADSRRQLVDQSFQSGFAELAKGVLHNLGNAMTPLGVRLAKLGERLRDAPIGDVELAVTELEREERDSPRYSDLQEFLRLGCRQLGTSLKDSQADVMVIQRQAVIVQSSLTDLMRSTRNDAVVESVRLPDLVSQTLEIVPDSCRQRLTVETDESLRKVGVVHVGRTVLRLVLQNLIINAADSVRDAGREKGVFRVAAEIVQDSGFEHLHLRCEDDGVGISESNLQRVFDQGFSTKSRDTNYGIGLHWCANAVAGLGGRIWAASEGPGRGASMHLMLPLNLRSPQIAT
jgi:two-component system NtrC family sensor kinase